MQRVQIVKKTQGCVEGSQPFDFQSAAGDMRGGEGRILPPPVAETGRKRPNEAQSAVSGSATARQCRIARFGRIPLPVSIYDRKNRVFSIF